jgi:hypothetical protein
MSIGHNDIPPIVGDVLVPARVLATPKQVMDAIADMNRMMDETHTFFRNYEREVYRRLPIQFTLTERVRADLDALQAVWFNLRANRDRLIVHLYYLEHPEEGSERNG